jgi:anti-sigma regulatory factor (Ser/Thr protein kinase)
VSEAPIAIHCVEAVANAVDHAAQEMLPLVFLHASSSEEGNPFIECWRATLHSRSSAGCAE